MKNKILIKDNYYKCYTDKHFDNLGNLENISN